MNWLVTTKSDVDPERLRERLVSWGCEAVDMDHPIPLNEGEQVFEAVGPRDLPQKAKGDALVLKISPSSEPEFYRSSS